MGYVPGANTTEQKQSCEKAQIRQFRKIRALGFLLTALYGIRKVIPASKVGVVRALNASGNAAPLLSHRWELICTMEMRRERTDTNNRRLRLLAKQSRALSSLS